MELMYVSERRDCAHDDEDCGRHATLAQTYVALPDYASPAFWHSIEAPDIPLEILTRCFRVAISRRDRAVAGRLFEQIVLRTQDSNTGWAQVVLRKVVTATDERYMLIHDLCADLHERLLRALMDPQRLFWEENFLHCLRFERKHVYQSFLMREGRWRDLHVKKGTRIPKDLIIYLSALVQQEEIAGEGGNLALFEDEQARAMLQSVEEGSLLQLVLHLPDKLKAVILLVFWEGRTEKETAHVLGISDRTVRNHIREACRQLRAAIPVEEECVYG